MRPRIVIPISEGENGRTGVGEWISRTACVSGAAIESSTVSGKFNFDNGVILQRDSLRENKHRQRSFYIKRNFSKSVSYVKHGHF